MKNLGGPFRLDNARYEEAGGKRGNVGGTIGEAVLLPFAPRGRGVSASRLDPFSQREVLVF